MRLGACARVFAEAAADGGGDGDGAGLLDAAHGHAGVLGLHDDHHADGLEAVEERVGDLGGQALLHLQAAREGLDEARELRQPDDAPALRDVGEVAPPDEGREVVLAERGEVNVFDDHHLVVLVAGQGHDVLVRVFAHPRGQLGVHLRDAPRGLLQAGPLRVFADAFEDEADAPRDLLKIDSARGTATAFSTSSSGSVAENLVAILFDLDQTSKSTLTIINRKGRKRANANGFLCELVS